jgi:hypothetical protein
MRAVTRLAVAVASAGIAIDAAWYDAAAQNPIGHARDVRAALLACWIAPGGGRPGRFRSGSALIATARSWGSLSSPMRIRSLPKRAAPPCGCNNSIETGGGTRNCFWQNNPMQSRTPRDRRDGTERRHRDRALQRHRRGILLCMGLFCKKQFRVPLRLGPRDAPRARSRACRRGSALLRGLIAL